MNFYIWRYQRNNGYRRFLAFYASSQKEECYVYERQPCWYLGKGCQARLHINADGTQATFIDDAGEQKWAVDSIADCARRFMAHPQVKGRRVYGQVGFNFAAHARGLPLTPGSGRC